MDIVFSGELPTENKGLKDVLQEILRLKIAGTSILRITSSNNEYSGRIFILDGQTIRSATITVSEESPFNVLRNLLSVQTGNFAYLQVGLFDDVAYYPNLNINLEQIANILPNLPPDLRMLSDESDLIEKAFNRTNPQNSNEDQSPAYNLYDDIANNERATQPNQQLKSVLPQDENPEIDPYDNLGQNPDLEKSVNKTISKNTKLRGVELDPNQMYLKRNINIILTTVFIASSLSIVTYFFWENIRSFFQTANTQITHNLSKLTNGAISDPLNSDTATTAKKQSNTAATISKSASINKKPLKLKRSYRRIHRKTQNNQ